MPNEHPLTGGNISAVVRVGDTVRRAPGPWTPTVHALLRHLDAVGLEGTPRALGFDEWGREMLSHIDGVAGFFSPAEVRPPNLWTDQVLIEAARLLRRYHDATSGFVPPTDAVWQFVHPDPDRHEVVCHNDFAPYNCIFRDGHVHATIDFDTAGPGPRAWDVAYAAYRFVPLMDTQALPSLGLHRAVDRGLRLKLLCDAYGLERRDGFVDMIVERIDATRRMLLDGAAAGHAGYQAHLAEGGHIEGLERDRQWLERHVGELQVWVECSVI